MIPVVASPFFAMKKLGAVSSTRNEAPTPTRNASEESQKHETERTMSRYRCAVASEWREGGSERSSWVSVRIRSPSSENMMICERNGSAIRLRCTKSRTTVACSARAAIASTSSDIIAPVNAGYSSAPKVIKIDATHVSAIVLGTMSPRPMVLTATIIQ